MTTDTEPHTRRRWVSLAVLCASLLMVGTDLTVLHVAVPTISRQLVPSGAELLWIVDSYALTVAAGLITFGTLGDRYGRKRLLVTGFAVFGLASAGAAFSLSSVELIIARVALGIGGAIIMSNTPAIVRVIFPDDRERKIAVGLWVASYSVGVSIGPLLGGALLEHFWWGSVFLVNLLIAAAAVTGGVLLIPESKDPNPHRWDGIGAGLSALGLAAVVYAFQQLGGGRASALTWVIAAVGVMLVIAFVVRQRGISTPLVDMSHFGDRRLSLAALCVMGCYGAYAALLFLLTQRLQLVDGYSPLRAGLTLAPLAVANAFGSALAPRFDRRQGLSGGLLLLAAALAAFSLFGAAGNYVALVAAGLGAGAVMALGSDVMLGAARPEHAGQVGAIQETSFSLGAGLGLAFLGTMLSLVYRSAFRPVQGVTTQQWETARTSLGGASKVAAGIGGRTGDAVLASARHAFDTGFSVATAVAAAVLALLGVLAAVSLRTSAYRQERTTEVESPETEPTEHLEGCAASSAPRERRR